MLLLLGLLLRAAAIAAGVVLVHTVKVLQVVMVADMTKDRHDHPTVRAVMADLLPVATEDLPQVNTATNRNSEVSPPKSAPARLKRKNGANQHLYPCRQVSLEVGPPHSRRLW